MLTFVATYSDQLPEFPTAKKATLFPTENLALSPPPLATTVPEPSNPAPAGNYLSVGYLP